MNPLPSEIEMRADVLSRLTSAITGGRAMGPSTEILPVGSYVTGLYLPASDIDVVIVPGANSIYRYAETIRSVAQSTLQKIAMDIFSSSSDWSTNSVFQASVPLLQVTHKPTGIRLDLSFEKNHSVAATEIVKEWEAKLDKKHGPGRFRVLVLVMKQFLTMRRLGRTYTGGLNSYVLVWLVVAWMELEYAKKEHSGNIGTVLKGFLKFYGTEFDYYHTSIKFSPGPVFEPKPISYISSRRSWSLSIFDPADASIDMGDKVYAIKHLKATFAEAYRTLQSMEAASDGSVNKGGILGGIIGGDYSNFSQERAASVTTKPSVLSPKYK